MQPAIFIIPRWGGSAQTDWYAWLAGRVSDQYDFPVTVLEPPDWTAPDIATSVAFLDQQLPPLGEHTYLIGHSIGCQAWLHFLAARAARGSSFRVGGFLAVAGWFAVDEPWPALEPWLKNDNLLYDELTTHLGHCRVLLTDNDPFTADHAANRTLWRERLAAEVTVHAGAGHFTRTEEPAVLDALYARFVATGRGTPAPDPALPLRAQDPPIVVEETYAVPIGRVWQALTDHWHMQQWYFEQLEDFRPVPGFRTAFAVRSGERTFTHRWQVLAAEAPQHVRYTWRYAEYAGDGYADFRLAETPTGTRLTLTLEIVADYPADVPEFTRGSCIGGWDYFLGQRLRRYLEGGSE